MRFRRLRQERAPNPSGPSAFGPAAIQSSRQTVEKPARARPKKYGPYPMSNTPPPDHQARAGRRRTQSREKDMRLGGANCSAPPSGIGGARCDAGEAFIGGNVADGGGKAVQGQSWGSIFRGDAWKGRMGGARMRGGCASGNCSRRICGRSGAERDARRGQEGRPPKSERAKSDERGGSETSSDVRGGYRYRNEQGRNPPTSPKLHPALIHRVTIRSEWEAPD